MKLTLIQVDQTNPKIGHRFERYPPFFQNLFDGADFDFETAWVLDGAPLPDPAGLEGVIITGSKFGVYDAPPWIDPLRGFIRNAFAAKTPMLGVCFGHQIMADALGADVRKAPQGWGLGRQDYALAHRPSWALGLPADISLAASHQDQVLSVPEGAEIFLGSDFCPIAGLAYGEGAAVSLQPHPEYSPDYARALIDLRDGEALDADQARERRASLEAQLHDKEMGEALARFFLER
jgi:GMP synthase-like glutamine amidotransferase